MFISAANWDILMWRSTHFWSQPLVVVQGTVTLPTSDPKNQMTLEHRKENFHGDVAAGTRPRGPTYMNFKVYVWKDTAGQRWVDS